MSELSREAVEALAPLRTFLADAARDKAHAAAHAVQKQSDALLKEAEGERDRLLTEAIADGEQTAEADAALKSARVRRQAAEVVLSQREVIRQSVRISVQTAATALREKSDYARLHTRLVARARALLGADVAITESPEGGIVAATDFRRLDLSLPALAITTLDEMGAEVSSLWTR